VVILDFSKAFDTVPHDKLMYNVQTREIQNKRRPPQMAHIIPHQKGNESRHRTTQSIYFWNIFVIPGARVLAHVINTMFGI
jgi:hypothetical protein